MPAAAKPTVVEALSKVMEDVQAVAKGDRNTTQGYSFRGVDAVVNAVGPVLRKHGVVAVPVSVSYESERYATSKGAAMRGVTLAVGFRFYGPAGDYIEAMVAGEASDSGDKAIPKAHSVAYRTLLLQALCIPTDEPDPDSQSHERAVETQVKAEVKSQFQAPDNGKATTAQQKQLAELIAETKITEEQVGHATNGKATSELTKAEALDLIGRLRTYAQNLKATT